MIPFNVENGYLDAVLRGYRNGIIEEECYECLAKSQSISELVIQLSLTAYGESIQSSPEKMSPSVLGRICREVYAQEFLELKKVAKGTLAVFLDYVSRGYIIENVILLITGAHHDRETKDLLEQCNPIGLFEGMSMLTSFCTVEELYNMIMIETQIASYFSACLSQPTDEKGIEMIRNILHKLYLEDFYSYCRSLGGITFQIMKEILQTEADRRTLNIVINSLRTGLSGVEKYDLCPNIGRIEPGDVRALCEAQDIGKIMAIVALYPDYYEALGLDKPDCDIDEAFLRQEIKQNKESFLYQYNYAVFYSYMKLKEQEIKNIVWIAECVAQRQARLVSNYISIF